MGRRSQRVAGRLRLGLLAAVALGTGLGLGLATHSVAQNEGNDPQLTVSFAEVDTMALPPLGRIAGVTWMGPDSLAVLLDVADTLSASGEREMRLIFQNTAGEIFRDEDFSGVLDRALAWDGEFLWSCGDAEDGSSSLYKVGVDSMDVWQVAEAYDTPGHRPSDMCFDGRFVWITDRDSGRIDRFDPEVEEITRSALTPGFSPFGVAWDGQQVWLTDAGTGLMYRLSGSRRTWSATVDTESFMHRGEDVLLLAAGQNFWYIPAGQNFAVGLRFQ
jgi:hypothetical protein